MLDERDGVRASVDNGVAIVELCRPPNNFFDLAMIRRIADVYAYRGDKDRAFEWLERARRQRDGLGFMRGDPFFANLHEDPRWDVFLRKMVLADDQLK